MKPQRDRRRIERQIAPRRFFWRKWAATQQRCFLFFSLFSSFFLIIFACVSFSPIVQMQLSGARAFWQVTSARLSCYFYWRCRACTRAPTCKYTATENARVLFDIYIYIYIFIYTRWERNDSPGAGRCWSITYARGVSYRLITWAFRIFFTCRKLLTANSKNVVPYNTILLKRSKRGIIITKISRSLRTRW